MVEDMKLVAIVLILAALIYILYLWTKRKDQIACPECGARVNIYADECPHCGHEKGEPVHTENTAAETAGAASGPANQPAAPESREPSGPDGPSTPEPAQPGDLAGDTPSPAEAMADDEAEGDDGGDEDVDYAAVVENTIPKVKKQILENDLDPQKVLEAEKENKDRVTLTDWLQEQLAQH